MRRALNHISFTPCYNTIFAYYTEEIISILGRLYSKRIMCNVSPYANAMTSVCRSQDHKVILSAFQDTGGLIICAQDSNALFIEQADS